MKLHRFILDFNPDDIVSGPRPERRGLKVGSLKLEDAELFNQSRNVLKLKVGEKIIICDGRGNEGTAEIQEYGRGSIVVEILEININKNEPDCYIVLYCSILKRENFELVIQKATEIGVKEIVPIITDRTIKLDIRKDRLEKIIREAAEQSGRGIVPVLHEPLHFYEVVKHPMSNDPSNKQILFDLSGESFDKLERLEDSKRIGVWIGPEGGWTGQELELVRSLENFKIINLGKLTLRAETAAITATYLVVHNLICR